ncbi:hypothetical protein [Tuwongella immobilis]|uniref:Uncharacterized protein n=1 Tax=Tuwongella immobilis TaxID=692036 RepID=A0A6C2YV83_9BACT|nr:hypothetical protein [Tuwongella immobilis]VIP05520.1 unnamed protein product [Tuwongella immobilis]VTS08396.1 unnamed protein product [Tuwongella immobilis]
MESPRPLPTTLLVGTLLLTALFLPTLSAPWDCSWDGSRFDPAGNRGDQTALTKGMQVLGEMAVGTNALPWRMLGLLTMAGSGMLLARSLFRRGLAEQTALVCVALFLWNPTILSEWLRPMSGSMLGLPLAILGLGISASSASAAATGAWTGRMLIVVAACCQPAWIGLLLMRWQPVAAIAVTAGLGASTGAWMPLALSLAWTVAVPLDRFITRPVTNPVRLGWIGLGGVLAIAVVGTMGQMDRQIARAKMFDEVLQWCLREALPGETIGWTATNGAPNGPSDTELGQFGAHLRRVGRGDLQIALYDTSSQSTAPRYRVALGEPGESDLSWSLLQPVQIRYWAGSRQEVCTITERNDVAAAQAAWLRAELERAIAPQGSLIEK